MNDIYIPINSQDILTGRTSTTSDNIVAAGTTIGNFYTCSVQKNNSSSYYYMSIYESNAAVYTDDQLFDIGYGTYTDTHTTQYYSSSKANYKLYAQQCLSAPQSKFSFNGTNDCQKIVFINYNDILLKDRINISNYSLTLKYGSATIVVTPSTQSVSSVNLNPLCGRSRYLLDGSDICGWLLYDKKLVLLDGAYVSSSLGFN